VPGGELDHLPGLRARTHDAINSRGPETLKDLIDELGSSARAATAAGAAAAGDFAVVAVPLRVTNDMPTEELAGKIVLDTNNYMIWRDGHIPVELVTRLYDQFGFDAVDNSPLHEAWRSAPGQPAWDALQYQTRDELINNLAIARRRSC
jgi:predicted dinucleotide-binding enzyme